MLELLMAHLIPFVQDIPKATSPGQLRSSEKAVISTGDVVLKNELVAKTADSGGIVRADGVYESILIEAGASIAIGVPDFVAAQFHVVRKAVFWLYRLDRSAVIYLSLIIRPKEEALPDAEVAIVEPIIRLLQTNGGSPQIAGIGGIGKDIIYGHSSILHRLHLIEGIGCHQVVLVVIAPIPIKEVEVVNACFVSVEKAF
jgi:hypothetical protein